MVLDPLCASLLEMRISMEHNWTQHSQEALVNLWRHMIYVTYLLSLKDYVLPVKGLEGPLFYR
jgi:hypothetical protein